MGITSWPCPGCGQQQKSEHPNGVMVHTVLCASCQEKKDKHERKDDGA